MNLRRIVHWIIIAAILIVGAPKAYNEYKVRMNTIKVVSEDLEIDKRNNQRKMDISQIRRLLSAVREDPEFIEAIPNSATEICRSDANDCTDLIDLGTLIDWPDIPYDTYTNDPRSTRYTIHKNKLQNPAFGGQKTHTFTITALDAESGAIITTTY